MTIQNSDEDQLNHEVSDDEKKSELFNTDVKHFDYSSITNISDVLNSMQQTGFQSRNLGLCYSVMNSIINDSDRPLVLLGLAGAMIPAGMKKIIRDMIKFRIIDVLVTTGANMYHDLYESLGNSHYLAQSNVDDNELRRLNINRMLDVYADDDEFINTDLFIQKFADGLNPGNYSTREFLFLLGGELSDNSSILQTAWEEECPIFCPSIADSSLGIGLAMHKFHKEKMNKSPLMIDVLKDNIESVHVRRQIKKGAGIYVGGGVPKNYIQQITPMSEVMGVKVESLSYGIQITTDDPKWGGLSGCTFEESQSWGKYDSQANFATLYIDATIALPLLFSAIMEHNGKSLPRSKLNLISDLNNDDFSNVM